MENLSIIIQQNNLDKSDAKSILERFGDYEKIAKEWEIKAKAIVVTDSSQVTEMAMAREARKKFSAMRIDLEKARKAIGEPAFRKYKAINAIASYLQTLINPIEEHLKLQEDFIKIQAEQKALQDKIAMEKAQAEQAEKEAKQQALKVQQFTDRRIRLAKYAQFGRPNLTIDTTNKEFNEMLQTLKERKAKYEAEQEHNNVLNARRAKVASYSMLNLTNIDTNVDVSEETFNTLINKLEDLKLKYLQDQADIKAENERIKKEQEEKQKQLDAEKEKARLLEAEKAEKLRIENEQKAKAEADKAEAELKPDIEKAVLYIDKLLEVEMPVCNSGEVVNNLHALRNYILEYKQVFEVK